MPNVNYNAVADSINRFTDRVERGTQAERADKRALLGLGLQKAQFDLGRQRLAGEQALGLAKAEKDAFLSEVVTGRQAIMDSPNWSQEQKDAYIKFAETHGPKGFLDGIAFPRGVWAERIGQSLNDYRKEQAEQDYRNKLLGLRRKEVSAREKTARDTRGTMQKDVEFIQQTRGATPQAALDEYLKNKSLPERIRLYNNELNRLSEDLDFQGLDNDKKAQKIDELRNAYKISDVMDAENPGPKQLSREQAIDYMRRANGDKSKAMQMAKDDGYQF